MKRVRRKHNLYYPQHRPWWWPVWSNYVATNGETVWFRTKAGAMSWIRGQ